MGGARRLKIFMLSGFKVNCCLDFCSVVRAERSKDMFFKNEVEKMLAFQERFWLAIDCGVSEDHSTESSKHWESYEVKRMHIDHFIPVIEYWGSDPKLGLKITC